MRKSTRGLSLNEHIFDLEGEHLVEARELHDFLARIDLVEQQGQLGVIGCLSARVVDGGSVDVGLLEALLQRHQVAGGRIFHQKSKTEQQHHHPHPHHEIAAEQEVADGIEGSARLSWRPVRRR